MGREAPLAARGLRGRTDERRHRAAWQVASGLAARGEARAQGRHGGIGGVTLALDAVGATLRVSSALASAFSVGCAHGIRRTGVRRRAAVRRCARRTRARPIRQAASACAGDGLLVVWQADDLAAGHENGGRAKECDESNCFPSMPHDGREYNCWAEKDTGPNCILVARTTRTQTLAPLSRSRRARRP